MRFYLGTHKPSWLSRTEVPLFVSRNTLKGLVTFPRARGPWSLDSGGFTEVETHGRWTVPPADYAREVRLWQREIGNLDFAAPQDTMSEPPILLRSLAADGYVDGVRDRRKDEDVVAYRRYLAKKSEEFPSALLRQRVCVHQNRTIQNLIALRELAPEVPWMPVLQGWWPEDYVAHAEAYARAGIDLRREPVVGLGSVCRRERLDDARKVIAALAGPKWRLRLHGFGLKTDGFEDPVIAAGLVSADSLAWSLGGSLRRRQGPRCTFGRDGGHSGGCGNCIHWALEWRERTLKTWERTMLGRERARGGRRRIAANPGGDWEDLPPMFVAPPAAAPETSTSIVPVRPDMLPALAGEDLVGQVAASSGDLRFPEYQAALLREGIRVGLEPAPGLGAEQRTADLRSAIDEIASAGDATFNFLVRTGLVDGAFMIPDEEAAVLVHRALLDVAGDTARPVGLRSGALDLLKRIEASTSASYSSHLGALARQSGSMMTLWRSTRGGGALATCRGNVVVDVRKRQEVMRVLADPSTSWLNDFIKAFPATFRDLYGAAWRRHEEAWAKAKAGQPVVGGDMFLEMAFENMEEFEDFHGGEENAELEARHSYAYIAAIHDVAELLNKAGAEACVFGTCPPPSMVCEFGYEHAYVFFRHPTLPGFWMFGIDSCVWNDPPTMYRTNVAFCQQFAAGQAELTDMDWDCQATTNFDEREWRRYCQGIEDGDDDWYERAGVDRSGSDDYDDGDDE